MVLCNIIPFCTEILGITFCFLNAGRSNTNSITPLSHMAQTRGASSGMLGVFFRTVSREEHGRVLPGSSQDVSPPNSGVDETFALLANCWVYHKIWRVFLVSAKGAIQSQFGSQWGVCYESEGMIGPPYRSPVVDSLSAVCLALICVDGNGTAGHSCFTLCEHFDCDWLWQQRASCLP